MATEDTGAAGVDGVVKGGDFSNRAIPPDRERYLTSVALGVRIQLRKHVQHFPQSMKIRPQATIAGTCITVACD